MRLNEQLRYAFEQIRGGVHRAVRGLDAEQLAWRPDPDANSIGWLVWHLARVQDDHMSEIAGAEQTWTQADWAPLFGLPSGAMDTGYGHSSDEVAAVRPRAAADALRYYDEVTHATLRTLERLDDGDFDRIIDRSYDPPVSVGVRIMSVIGDDLQHVGQAAYVRGMLQRRST